MRIVSPIIISLLITFAHNGQANSFKTEQWHSKNGVKVVFYEAKEVPMLDISLAFAAGSAYDGSHYGLSALTTKMINEGSAGLDATVIAESLADTGAQFDIAASRDMVVLNLRTLTRDDALKQSTTTFAQIINHPDFPEEAFQREKKQLLMAIEQTGESPDDVANQNFFNKLYQQHPYAHPVNGTARTMSAITKQQVMEFYKNYYLANNAVLVLVGDINSTTAHQLADKLTQDLPHGTTPAAIPKALSLNAAEQVVIPFPASQTVIRLGQLGIDHHNPHYFPLIVGNYILGGGALVSRLAIEVREKRGLTYSIDSQFVPMLGKGPFLISLSTKNAQANNALKVTQDTLNAFIKEGPDAKELESAKQYLTGSFPMSLGSNKNIAALLVRMTFYQLPNNYLDTYIQHINSVTIKDIKDAFQKEVNPDKLLLVMVGKK
ncbi:MAG: pitrilysin family protein [bacterium]|nr:pitrilysin family protein [bacterium]